MIEKSNRLSIRKQCKLLGITRSNYYYVETEMDKEEYTLLEEIDRQYLDHPFYGSRKMTQVLKRKGIPVGRDRVRRLMRTLGIKAIYPQKQRLSIGNKEHKIYPYLLNSINIDRPNKAWAADITYIPLKKGFMYLVAIIDLYSRFVISWKLSNTMDTDFCVEVLNEALSIATPEYFNTDQGSQFTSIRFTEILKSRGIKISMDGKGRMLDNIFIERFWRSLKYEEVYLKHYEKVSECKEGIAEYMKFYNYKRVHQSLSYRVPSEVYQGHGNFLDNKRDALNSAA